MTARPKIAVIDYGVGNLFSVTAALRRAGAEGWLTRDPGRMAEVDGVVLPGVGAFDAAMELLGDGAVRQALERKVLEERVPTLGICLGMQVMTQRSDEGNQPGLGWLAATTERLPRDEGLKLPHLGWSEVRPTHDDPLWEGMAEGTCFYFAHSYHVHCQAAEHVAAVARHGSEFTAAIQVENIRGVQFHPERSHAVGLRLLRNFVGLCQGEPGMAGCRERQRHA